jgi:hypothetical protein
MDDDGSHWSRMTFCFILRLVLFRLKDGSRTDAPSSLFGCVRLPR